MGIGYILGCLVSILLWKIDRQQIFRKINDKLIKIFREKIIVEVIYLSLIIGLFFLYYYFGATEYMNFLTAFLIIDISYSERYNLNLNDKIQFYKSLSLLTKGILCGFIAPLFYIMVFRNNYYGLVYFMIYQLYETGDYVVIDFIFRITTVIPSLILQGIYYIIYIFKNRTLKMDFKGDYFSNVIKRPILNPDIMAAYIENINFYYYFQSRNTSYIKSYGNFNSKIDKECIKDYLNIIYGIAFLVFIIFLIIRIF